MKSSFAAAIYLPILTIILSSCETLDEPGKVQSRIESFSELHNDFVGKTITVIPIDDAQRNSLEFKQYVSKLKSHLTAHGFKTTENSSSAPPNYFAFFDFGIDDGQRVVSTYTMPVWGETGVSSSYTSGRLSMYGNSGTYSGNTTYVPSYGVTGYTTQNRAETVYSRIVILNILKDLGNGQSQKAYEITLKSRGTCGRLSSLMDEFLTTLFVNFPNSTSDSIEIPIQGEC